jgi:hypothetical protein
MESVGGSATSKSLFGEEVLPAAPTPVPPVVDVLLKNTIFKTRRRRRGSDKVVTRCALKKIQMRHDYTYGPATRFRSSFAHEK